MARKRPLTWKRRFIDKQAEGPGYVPLGFVRESAADDPVVQEELVLLALGSVKGQDPYFSL
jgi:hypothetical protein